MNRATLFGVASTGRSGRTEAQEAAYLANVLERPIDLLYAMRPSLAADWGASPYPTWPAVMYAPKIAPAAVLDGSALPALRDFRDTIPADGTDWRFCYWQEPGDNIAGGEFTLGQYLNAFTIVADVFAERTDVLVGQNLSSWDFDVGNAAGLGAELVHPSADFAGVSLFANSANPNGAAGMSMRRALGAAYQAVAGQGIPFGLSSIGIATNQTQSQVETWMRYLATFAAAAAANDRPLDHVVCFSSDVGPAWTYKPWWMDGTAAILECWRELVDFL